MKHIKAFESLNIRLDRLESEQKLYLKDFFTIVIPRIRINNFEFVFCILIALKSFASHKATKSPAGHQWYFQLIINNFLNVTKNECRI